MEGYGLLSPHQGRSPDWAAAAAHEGGLSNSSCASHGAKQQDVVKTEAPCWEERRRQVIAFPAADIGPRPETGGLNNYQGGLSMLGSNWDNSRRPSALRSPTSMVIGEVVFNMFCFGAHLNNAVIKKAQRGAELVADLLRWVQHLEVDVLYDDGNQGSHKRNGAQSLLAACFTKEVGFFQPPDPELQPLWGRTADVVLNHAACTGSTTSRSLLSQAVVWRHSMWAHTDPNRKSSKQVIMDGIVRPSYIYKHMLCRLDIKYPPAQNRYMQEKILRN